MIIDSFEVIDFGRHSHLQAQLGQPVVGLMGPNGAGKTTLLSGLRYLFNGELEDAATSYIRNFGLEDGPKKAVLKASFRQHGSQGTITRTIGSSKSSRELVWEGKPYKTAADVDRVLGEILGANKAAIGAAIFIPQGDLDSMLFGKQSEREQMFSKILLVSHLEKISEAAELRARGLNSELEDLDVLSDELAIQRKDVEDKLIIARGEHHGLRRHDEELKEIREVNTLRDRVGTALAQLQASKTTATAAEDAVRSFEAAYENYKRDQGITVSLDALRAQIEEISQRVQHGDVLRARKQSLELGAQQVQTITSRIDAARLEVQVHSGHVALAYMLPELRASIETAKDRIRKTEELKVLNEVTIPAALSALSAAEAKLLQLVPLETIDGWKKELAADADVFAVLNTSRDIKTKLLAHTQALCNCPACSRPLEGLTVTQEEVDALTLECSNRQTVMQQKQRNIQNAENGYAAANEDIQAARTTLALHETTKAGLVGWLEANPAGDTVESMETNIRDIEHSQRETARLNEAIKTDAQTLENVRASLATLEPMRAEIEALNQAQLEADRVTLAGLRLKEPEYQRLLSLYTDSLGKRDFAQDNVKKATEFYQSKLTEFEAAELKMKNIPQLGMLEKLAAEADQDIITYLEERNSLFDKTGATLKAAEEAVTGVVNRQRGLEERKAVDADKRAVIADLNRIKEAFARSGLPMAYIRYRFEQLTELTRMNLAKIGANFTVDVDPEQACTFSFTRVDEPIPYVMMQNKLSGGQRVRLSVAFLLAIQQLIIPEVGLLVLDEPSMHLDPEGKESLKTLLLDMSRQLGNTESQVIVCDHAQELEPAFGSIIRVK